MSMAYLWRRQNLGKKDITVSSRTEVWLEDHPDVEHVILSDGRSRFGATFC